MNIERIFVIVEFIFCLMLVTAMLFGAIAAITWYVTGENLAILFGG
jgi:hypothetical protein